MKCLTCERHSLEFVLFDDGLKLQACSHCGGMWLSSNDFLAWRRSHAPDGQVIESDISLDTTLAITDSTNLKRCLDCGHLMFRFDVLPHGRYKIDHCGHCNGIWLDGNEWHWLRAHNVHQRPGELFTAVWQSHIREVRQHDWFDQLYTQRFGSDYEKIKAMRDWITNHDKRAMIVAFLTARDPFGLD